MTKVSTERLREVLDIILDDSDSWLKGRLTEELVEHHDEGYVELHCVNGVYAFTYDRIKEGIVEFRKAIALSLNDSLIEHIGEIVG